MVLMAGYELPVRAIRQQAAAALDMIVHLDRMRDGSRKVTKITEVQRMESDMITLQELFEYKVQYVGPAKTVSGALIGTGLRPGFLPKFEWRGIPVPAMLQSRGNPGTAASGFHGTAS
jgi:pilus assembly protein CpaF